jgi:hypothetical protein
LSDRPAPTSPPRTALYLPGFVAVAAAVVGRLPAFGAWWHGQDWTRLAAAAGLESGVGQWPIARLYWLAAWPLCGLDADLHTGLRLALHGAGAWLLVDVARRSGLGRRRRALAGLVFAASPLAFAPLYTASEIGVLLAVVCALGAVDLWLGARRGGRRRLVWAALLGVLAAGSHPVGLGLPLLLLGFLWSGVGLRLEDKAFAWALVFGMLLAAIGILAAVVGPQGLPRTAPALDVLARLGAAGWWLVSPAPAPLADITGPMAGAGGLLLLGWAAWAAVGVRRRDLLPLLGLLAMILAAAPALLAGPDPRPGALYPAVPAFALVLGAAVPPARLRGRDLVGTVPLIGLLAFAAVTAGFFGMEARLGRRDTQGMLNDPLARATALSWEGCRAIGNLRDRPLAAAGPAGLTHLVLLQPPETADALETSVRLGERWARPTPMFTALGGARGPSLLLGPGVRAAWANGLTTASRQAVVLCEGDTGFHMWGRTDNALLYAALTDVARGQFARARAHLRRAAELSGEQIMFIYDEGQMVVPLRAVVARRQAFVDWTLGLLDAGVSRLEVGGLQDMFFNLLSRATGRSVADLAAGSHLVGPPRQAPDESEDGARPDPVPTEKGLRR